MTSLLIANVWIRPRSTDLSGSASEIIWCAREGTNRQTYRGRSDPIPLNASTLDGSNADISACSREFSFASSPYCSLVYPYAVGGRHRKGHGAVVEPENILRIEAPRSILMLS